jgi:glycine reductase
MNLAMASYRVQTLRVGDKTSRDGSTLTISPAEIRDVALSGPSSITDLTIEIAHPGDRVRIVHALDAIEPRIKVGGTTPAFPGFLGPARTVGSGRTNRLAGVTVIESAQLPQPTSGILEFNEGLIDMSGPGAPRCACSNTANLILCFRLSSSATNDEADADIRLAALRVADFLASQTLGREADESTHYSLDEQTPGLPRVVYVDQVQQQGPLVQTFLYGVPVNDLVPTVLHPNEMLDGAVVSGNYRSMMKVTTALHCNNPVLLSLYARHGKELNFAGVVFCRGHFPDHQTKERNAYMVAKLAKMIGADGAVQTLEGTGNSNIDFMLIAKALKEAGIIAVQVMPEFGGHDGRDWPLVDYVPEAETIVSVGSINRKFDIPEMERSIGGATIVFTSAEGWGRPLSATSAMEVTAQEMYGGFWQMGISGLSARDF